MNAQEYEYGIILRIPRDTYGLEGLVFIKTGVVDGRDRLQCGTVKKNVEPDNWKRVKGDGLIPGDPVQLLENKNIFRIGILTGMKWDKLRKKIKYVLRSDINGPEEHFYFKKLKKLDALPDFQANPELEAIIDQNPNDKSAWAVYADWLQSAGDPRGELLALDAAAGVNPENLAINAKRNKLAEIYEKQPIWDLQQNAGLPPGEDIHISLEWKAGFIRKASIRPYTSAKNHPPRLVSFLNLLLGSGASRFLTKLELNLSSSNILTPVLQAASFTALRRLKLKGDAKNMLENFLSKTPNLESLYLDLRDYPDNVNRTLKKLFRVDSALPRLKDLEIQISSELDDLTLFNRMIPSPLLIRLEKLTMKVQTLSPEGAVHLLNNQAELGNLKELFLKYQTSSENEIQSLKDVFGERLKLKKYH